MSKVSKSSAKSKMETKEEEKKNTQFFKSTKKKEEKNNDNTTPKNLDTVFVLKDINFVNLDRSYGMKDIQDFIYKNSNSTNKTTENTTKINTVNPKNDLRSITTKLENLGFSDKFKEPFETIVRGNVKSNIYSTFNNKKDLVKNCQHYKCWYDRHPLIPGTLPLSLPIKYYPSYVESSIIHNSLINTVPKLNVTINTDTAVASIKDKEKVFYDKVNLSSVDKEKYLENEEECKKLADNDYFEGEGVFCSFNCMFAYLFENYCIKYKNSGMLLNKLYKSIFGHYPKQKIIPSPSWKLLQEYGGDWSIEEYRKNFQVVDYSCCWQYNKNLPYGPVSELFLENKLEKDQIYNKNVHKI